MKNGLALCAGIGLAIALLASSAIAQESPTRKVEEFRDWTTYEHRGAPGDICFAVSTPKETTPAGISRDDAYFYLSAWPKDGVKSEVSIKMGYDIRENSSVVVEIGNESFELFSKGDKAFVSDPNEELKLVNAMRRGSTMVVRGTSEANEQTTDTYSLIGVTAALNAVNACE